MSDEPDLFDLVESTCVACEGSGVASSGRPCYPCGGTGQRNDGDK